MIFFSTHNIGFECRIQTLEHEQTPLLRLIDWGLTPFLTISQLYITAASSPTHAFPGFLTPVLHTTNFPSNWLLFHIDLVEDEPYLELCFIFKF